MIRRILYLIFYFNNLDWYLFRKFTKEIKSEENYNTKFLWPKIIYNSLKYNVSILEYFQFGFYNSKTSNKKNWAGTGYMYEYQLIMNPKDKRSILEDKIQFHKLYKKYIKRFSADLRSIKSDSNILENILQKTNGKIVLKLSTGQVGKEVKIFDAKSFEPMELIKKMESEGYDLIEEYIDQHSKMSELSSSGVNTVRIITQLFSNNQVDILGARLRITVNSPVDNMAAGNLAAPIDINSGQINGPAVYSDITKDDEIKHPVTGVTIPCFAIPYWNETVQMAKDSALAFPQNKSIGWDIAITDNGPELVEGNHNWCKLLWQLPVKKGLKPVLDKYLA